MCTVAFIPYNGKYFIASLRDEHPNRAKANLPELSILHQQKYIAPIDPIGGGTWVGINEAGTAIVLLNGGFNNHQKKDHYLRSRGQIVTELLSSNLLPIDHWKTITLLEIEPFTLIIWTGTSLMQFVWDGEKKHEMPFDENHAHIWSSSTLYDENEKANRQKSFDHWISNTSEKNQLALLDFFITSIESKEPIFIKNTIEIKTHSYTFIEINQLENNSISYHDLSAETITHFPINNQ